MSTVFATRNPLRTDRKFLPLKNYFEYLKNLGEVQATRVVATLVDGMQGHTNRDDNIDVTYLPISMGYRSCYKRYMKSPGYDVSTAATGGFVVTAFDEGKEVDPVEYITFPTYFNMWKRDFKDLKVSPPAEDIYKNCYVFANRHRHLVNHNTRRHNRDDISDSDDKDDDGDDNDADIANLEVGVGRNVDLNQPEAASNEVDEEMELMLIQAAEHLKMARSQ
jgi:hypothetical protein